MTTSQSASPESGIDSKRYAGKATVRTRLFRQPALAINGRDRSKLADGLANQVALVRACMTKIAPELPIHGALCFVGPGLPAFRTLTFRGFPLLYPKGLAKRINASGSESPEDVDGLTSALAGAFPRA